MPYKNYNNAPRPTEFLWATNLANLMIDTTDAAAMLWREMSLNGKCQSQTIEAFLQNFYSLFHHTAEYMHEDKSVVVKTRELLKSDLRLTKEFERKKVVNALDVFEQYNRRLHHTPAIMKIVEEANTFYDSGD